MEKVKFLYNVRLLSMLYGIGQKMDDLDPLVERKCQ